jgi:hypothetical protein
MNRLALVGCVVSFSACFDFDKAYQKYCEGDRCTPDASIASGGGSTGGGGSPATGAGSTGGGGSVAAGGAQGGGSASGGGAIGGGGSIGGGSASGGGMAACLPWGSSCSGDVCCEKSDAGLNMACARNKYCLEVPDCRGGMTSCSTNEQCCSNRCDTDAGLCSTRSGSGPCTTGTDCFEGYMCLSGMCTSANSTPGALCNTSDSCRESTNWCDMADAGPHNGVCVAPTNGCTVLGSALTTTCCPGLEYFATGTNLGCRLPLGSWCYADSACASDNCIGDRCVADFKAPFGGRCFFGRNCLDPSTYCDPTTLTCVNRICIPPLLNFGTISGCCTVSYQGGIGICRFADAGTCLIGGESSPGNAAACCSGLLTPMSRCTEVTLSP